MITDIIKIGSTIIDKIFPDKEAAAKAKIELVRLQQEGELKELEVRMSAIITEANSKDPWTSRARPSFMYVMYIMILFALPMGFVSAYNPEIAGNIANGMKFWLAAIPESMWATFGAGYLGYAGFRTYEKVKDKTK